MIKLYNLFDKLYKIKGKIGYSFNVEEEEPLEFRLNYVILGDKLNLNTTAPLEH